MKLVLMQSEVLRAHISGEILSGCTVGETKQILREEEQKSLGKMEMLTTRKSSSFDSATNFPIITPEKDETKRGKFILFPRPCDLRVSLLKCRL